MYAPFQTHRASDVSCLNGEKPFIRDVKTGIERERGNVDLLFAQLLVGITF